MAQQKWILFDFDGVFVDSFDAAFTLSQHLLHTKNEVEYRELFKKSIADELQKKIKPNALRRFFRNFNRTVSVLPIVPGMAELAVRFAKQYMFAVVSSSYTGTIKTFFEKAGIVQYFTEILGYDAGASKSDKIDSLLKAYNIATSECVMVTDTLGDVREAALVGVRSIAVAWGYEREKDFQGQEVLGVAHTPRELETFVNTYFNSL